jgi:hypothetical protein
VEKVETSEKSNKASLNPSQSSADKLLILACNSAMQRF